MPTDPTTFPTTKAALYQRLRQVAARRQAGLHLIMESVDHPSNLGLIARTCDALGIQHISFVPTKRHAREKRLVIQSSVAASQWLDFTEFTDTQTHLAQRKADGWYILATSPDPTATSLYDIDFTAHPKLALMVGSETRGLSPTAFAHAHQKVTIPMTGVVESLNVAVATSILLAQAVRHRQQPHFLLPPQAQQTLVDTWIQRRLQKQKYTKHQA